VPEAGNPDENAIPEEGIEEEAMANGKPQIAFIGFGEAGQAIAAGLREAAAAQMTAWDILFRKLPATGCGAPPMRARCIVPLRRRMRCATPSL